MKTSRNRDYTRHRLKHTKLYIPTTWLWEKIFFEEKIYKELEQKHETWEKVIIAIDKAFGPFKKRLKREIQKEDILKLTEKPVRRIYRLDINELNEQIKGIEADMQQVKYDLEHLTDYAVAYFENLQKKY